MGAIAAAGVLRGVRKAEGKRTREVVETRSYWSRFGREELREEGGSEQNVRRGNSIMSVAHKSERKLRGCLLD